MHDDGHPYRLESREFLEQVEVMKNGSWYSGTAIETAKEMIYFLPNWDFVLVDDKTLIALSWAKPAGRWN